MWRWDLAEIWSSRADWDLTQQKQNCSFRSYTQTSSPNFSRKTKWPWKLDCWSSLAPGSSLKETRSLIETFSWSTCLCRTIWGNSEAVQKVKERVRNLMTERSNLWKKAKTLSGPSCLWQRIAWICSSVSPLKITSLFRTLMRLFSDSRTPISCEALRQSISPTISRCTCAFPSSLIMART